MRADLLVVDMRKVLIADDEQLICRMITKMIDWEGKALKLAGTADNGLTLLQMIEDVHPDIVITDIRMPGLDGLSLIERALAVHSQLDFIIISGYKNFEYAHQALTLGVRHYLLKPIDEAELSETLDRIIREKEKDDESRSRSEALEEERFSHRQNVRQHFLNNILRSANIGVGEETEDEDSSLAFRNSRYLAFLVKVDWTEEGEIAPGILEILSAIIEREEREWGCEYVNSHVKSGVVSVINYPKGARESHPDDMEGLFTKCRKEIDKFSGYSVTIGVGSEKGGIGETRQAIDEAVAAVKCRIRKGLGRIIFFDRLSYQKVNVEEMVNPSRKGMARAVESLDAEAVKNDFQLMSEEIRANPRNSPAAVFELTEIFRDLIVEVFRDNAVDEKTAKAFADETDLLMDRATSEPQLVQYFEDAVERFFRQILSERRRSGQAPVRQAKAYLSEHFRENPTLEQVSDVVGMSPAYFSTLFKKELGIGFSEYLTQLRCEEAKRLMRETGESMNRIAEDVGYLDAKYFSRIFRKTVGIKPSEYRKLYR